MPTSSASKPAKTYAGLDVSLKETAICIVDESGEIVWERTVPTDPQVIAKYLAKRAPGLERVGLESVRLAVARAPRRAATSRTRCAERSRPSPP